MSAYGATHSLGFCDGTRTQRVLPYRIFADHTVSVTQSHVQCDTKPFLLALYDQDFEILLGFCGGNIVCFFQLENVICHYWDSNPRPLD